MDSATIQKLKKLLRLARRGGTEAEANAAMEKVQLLLAKHNLSMDEIDTPDDPIRMQALNYRADYMRVLAISACRLCMCEGFGDSRRLMTFYIIGRESNITSARLLFDYLRQTLERLIKDTPKQRAYRSSFRNAYASRIQHRIAEMIQAAKTRPLHDAETGKELIVSSAYNNAAKEIQDLTGEVPRSQRELSLEISSFQGALHGDSAGRSVNLSKQLTNSTTETGSIEGR